MLVCFASEKGGAGKTTLAAILAERLHTLGRPLRVADADPQASLAALAERSEGRLPPVAQVVPDDLPELARDPGLVLLDLPSGLGLPFHAALAAADVAVVPVAPSAFDLRSLPTTLTQLRRAQDLRDGAPRGLIVPNKVDLRDRMSKELLAALARIGWPVSQRWLPERSAYRRLGTSGLGALPRTVRRVADEEVATLADEVLEFLAAERAEEAA